MWKSRSIDEYYFERINLIKSEILEEDDDYLMSIDTEELVEYYLQKAKLFEPVDIKFDQKTLSPRKEVVTIRANERSFPYNNQGDLKMEKEYVDVCIPVTDDQDIYLINNLRTKNIVSGGSPIFKIEDKEIIMSIETKGYGVELSTEQIQSKIEQDTIRIKNWFDLKNVEISRNNSESPEIIKDFITNRKKKLLADDRKINELSKTMNIPLKKNPKLEATKVRLQKKRIIDKVKPRGGNSSQQYVLNRERVLDLVAIIDNQGHQFERIPNTCSKLQEEDLRDLILVGLNAIFEGSATGETFSKKGRTDIFLRIDKGNILIAECKNWSGEGLYLKTIDQILRYVTWRDNFGIIIVFCRRKNFTNVLDTAFNALGKHNAIIGSVLKRGSTRLISKHVLPEDDQKTVEIHHLFYNLYSEEDGT